MLASLLAGATGGELMLIAVYEEPLLEGVVPSDMGWRAVRKQAQAMLLATRASLRRVLGWWSRPTSSCGEDCSAWLAVNENGRD